MNASIIAPIVAFQETTLILRVTLKTEEVLQEAKALAEQGFRHILLVAGEHPKFVSNGYLEDCIRSLAHFIPSLSLEVGPMEQEDYVPLVRRQRALWFTRKHTTGRSHRTMHTAGPKKILIGDWIRPKELSMRAFAALASVHSLVWLIGALRPSHWPLMSNTYCADAGPPRLPCPFHA